MKNMSDEELIKQAAGFSCGCDKCLARVEPPRRELLSRLERGRKAIEAMEKILVAVEEVETLKNLKERIWMYSNKYQQSCKESADEN